jgi:hypothetical protein
MILDELPIPIVHAPIAYPAVHYLTAPLRAHGRQIGDLDPVNLWAGQTHELAPEIPAAALVRDLHRDALETLGRARARLRADERDTPARRAVVGSEEGSYADIRTDRPLGGKEPSAGDPEAKGGDAW